VNAVLKSREDRAEPTLQASSPVDECAYELAKDFSDNVYRMPTSNEPVSHVDSQRVLYRVSEQF